MCFGGDQIGILAVSRPVNDEVDFTKEDERILSLFAGYAASAIRNLYLPAQPQPILGKLQALHYMNLVINSSMDLHLTLDELIKQITTQLNVDAAAVFLLDMSFQRLEYASGMGFQVVNFKHNHLNLNWDYAGLAAHPRRVINCSEPTREIRDPVRVSLMTKEGFNSYCTVPLIAKGIPKGILEIYHRTALVRNAEWFDYLETLATQIAIAIDNDTLFHNMQRSNAELETVYDATLKSWTNALELRNIETEGHCQRVMELTLRLAHLMGISDVDLACMRRGALLHDVGKIGIPDNILFKPGQLTEKEWAIVRQHPAYTYELLSSYPFMRLAMDIPLHHH